MKSSDTCFCCGNPATTCDYESDDLTEMFCDSCSLIEAAAAGDAPTWMATFLTKVIKKKRARYYTLKENTDE